jgi:hypothetical protein
MVTCRTAFLAILVLGTVEAGWVAGGLPVATKQPIQLMENSLAQATRYLDEEDRVICFQALKLAMQVHSGQVRRDGTPFVTHPVAVAELVASWGMDASCVVAALLHDAVEDTPLTFGEVESKFGEEVRTLVQGVTRVSKLPEEKISELELKDKGVLCLESGDLLQLLDACAVDWRVAVLKVADRLHNMRTLSAMKPHKRARKAQETARVFVPLAHYLGAHEVGAELAELAQRHCSDDQPQHRKWAARLSSVVLTGRLQSATSFIWHNDRALAAVRPRRPSAPLRLRTSAAGGMMSAENDDMSSDVSSSHLIRLILGLNEPTIDADRARDLVLRLRPLRNRLAPYQMRHELHASWILARLTRRKLDELDELDEGE